MREKNEIFLDYVFYKVLDSVWMKILNVNSFVLI
jgi:hypothetical protein